MKCRAHHTAIADKIEQLRGFLRGWDPEDRIAAGAADEALGELVPTRVLALGKAARALARGAARRWPAASGFLLETRHGAPGPVPPTFQRHAGDHPVAGPRSAEATRALYAWLSEGGGPLLALISGGGSALLADPPPPWDLDRAAALERGLLRCGATIAEVNAVRCRLSLARGGGLRARLNGAPLCTGIWSDVGPRDWRRTSSGPTLAPPLTPKAETVLRRYRLVTELPLPPPAFLAGEADTVHLLADAGRVARDCARAFRARGWASSRLLYQEGTSPEDLAARLADIARETPLRPAAVVGAGECPVRVTGSGRGGRCSHLTAAVARALARERGWSFVALATDGVDGDAGGGAALSWDHRPTARDLQRALDACDTGQLLSAEGALLPRRASGNNLRDLWVLFLE